MSRERRRGRKVRGEKVRAHSNICLPLKIKSMTFLGSRARSLFSKLQSQTKVVGKVVQLNSSPF